MTTTPSPVYLFKHVKHGTQNIQNYCHQWLYDSVRVHHIRFRPRLHSGPRWGNLQRSPRPSSWFKGLILLREGREGRGEKGEEGNFSGTGGPVPSPFTNSWIRPRTDLLLPGKEHCVNGVSCREMSIQNAAVRLAAGTRRCVRMSPFLRHLEIERAYDFYNHSAYYCQKLLRKKFVHATWSWSAPKLANF